ncbi:YlbD family protein [Ornithinibacillus halotolerans]|uniref:Uncharacterized protein n=1 Tax=Ornithinibacillus halotolerans TaxID=1274357 RepID=A0A916S5D3_9BACI|nr:YlbD family protein [Ornithinibacillus halotolerans]GGA83741.1 hypothetical protein GCM10008025_28560 [Ornithinibacillus halotolerans]
MSENNLHPTVHQFRKFINDHPKLRKEIRKTGRSWQEYYEKWVLLGEEDSYWDKFKEEIPTTTSNNNEDNKSELFNQFMNYMEKVDIDKVQKQVHQLSGTIGTIQELIDQFQGSKKGSKENERHLFSLFKD